MRTWTIIALAVTGACFVAAVTGWLLTRPEHSSQTVLVEPTTTPLRDSIREPKTAKKKKGGAPDRTSLAGRSAPSRSSAPKSPIRPGLKQRAQSRSPAQKRQTPARKPKPSASPSASPQPAQTPSQPAPLVTVQTPGRTPSVCTPQIGINC